jgi:hypothetical protein
LLPGVTSAIIVDREQPFPSGRWVVNGLVVPLIMAASSLNLSEYLEDAPLATSYCL